MQVVGVQLDMAWEDKAKKPCEGSGTLEGISSTRRVTCHSS